LDGFIYKAHDALSKLHLVSLIGINEVFDTTNKSFKNINGLDCVPLITLLTQKAKCEDDEYAQYEGHLIQMNIPMVRDIFLQMQHLQHFQGDRVVPNAFLLSFKIMIPSYLRHYHNNLHLYLHLMIHLLSSRLMQQL